MSDPTLRTRFPSWLRSQMERAQLSVRALAGRTGFSQTAIRHWLSTDVDQTVPHEGNCGTLAAALGISENEVRAAAGRSLLPQEQASADYTEVQLEAANLIGKLSVALQPKAIEILRVLAA